MSEFPRLIQDNPDAVAWMTQVKRDHLENKMFGNLAASVIWSNATGPDGEQLVPIDPEALVLDINTSGYPVLNRHDPGRPLGKILTARAFTGADGSEFVAALVGFYAGGIHRRFDECGVDTTAVVALPSSLPALADDSSIIFVIDPRDIDPAWIEDILSAAPLPVKRTAASYNAADTLQELIRLGLPYIALVWNPFVKTIATEAGKDVYAALHQWLRLVLSRLAEHNNPLVEVQSIQDDCHVSFLFRGKNVDELYVAQDALPLAAAQAARLISNMKRTGHAPKVLIYEFDTQAKKWVPSYAELENGQLVVSNSALIAVENLPSGMSLGITRSKRKSLLPVIKRSEEKKP